MVSGVSVGTDEEAQVSRSQRIQEALESNPSPPKIIELDIKKSKK